MHLTTPSTLLLPLLSPALAARPKDAILLSEVQSLTLSASRKTTSRRVAPIPQLSCTSPKKLCSLPEISTIQTMRCLNKGSSYTSEDIEWSCTASLPSTLKLDRTEVICEGYDGPDDPYVLKGSCGVEYSVVLTEEGEQKYPHLVKGGWRGGGGGKGAEENDWGGYIFGVIFFGVVAWMIYSACVNTNNRNAGRTTGAPRRRGGGGGGPGPGPGFGGGGGGGGRGYHPYDDNADPPPPYPGTGGTQGQNKPTSSTQPNSGSGGWRPGFWSGLATGAAGAYMAGNRRQQQLYQNPNTGFWGGGNNYGSTWGSGGESSRWFGGGGGGSSSRSGSSSSSSVRHESTGFGSTTRR
ncbi:transmembrane protein [Podospora australis]|uniref:Store-operated calcium entry-associated regulatory factor n=1 Tax=Podospora australis TaxID=1536484 RepID=A0AAN7AMZ8_9PEZI|nr:transmembrane protein [Podospora australis]